MVRPIDPMRATAGSVPRGDGWRFELKWDGMRVLAHVEAGALHLWSSNGSDVTRRFPELSTLTTEFETTETVLDGEVVAIDHASGAPSFSRLQRRIHTVPDNELMIAVPAVYVVFDLLVFDGNDIRPLPFDTRREALESVIDDGPAWLVTAMHDDGDELLRTAGRDGLEGIVAKRRTGRYESGRRSKNWVKTKLTNRQEFVVLGYTPGTGGRASSFGSLLLGTRFGARLELCGRVGSGFDDRAVHTIVDRLQPTADASDPTWTDAEPTGRWLAESFVVEVDFTELTPDHRLRHPVYRGLRDDKSPDDVVFDSTRPA